MGNIIAGVDEAGRGPLAGMVMAAAVILPSRYDIPDLTDSKCLTEAKRQASYERILEYCIAYAVGRAEVEEIDRLNILQASLLAMQRAVAKLAITPSLCLVDGNQCPKLKMPVRAIIKGDVSEPCISAASIIAKVERDREMKKLHEEFPEYRFANHKGYGTKEHLQALQKYGPCPYHRRSFAPVKAVLVYLN